MDNTLFRYGLIILSRLKESNNCFSKIITSLFPLQHCVNTHLNAPDQQRAKATAFTEVLTLTDD